MVMSTTQEGLFMALEQLKFGDSTFSSKEIELDLSVVIIGRNEAAYISKCIEAAIDAGKISSRPFEVIYVDSASTDDSTLIASQYRITIIRIEPGEWRCAAAGRKIGTRFARGKYVAFLDGDMVCDPDWFRNALEYFDGRYGNVGAVGGNRIDIDLSLGKVRHVKHFNGKISELLKLSGASIISRDALAASGGFDPYLISFEERELAGRVKELGFRVLGVPHTMVEHYGPVPSIRETLRRKNYGYHIGLGQYLRRLWKQRKIKNLLFQIKVQIVFWIWIICMLAALFVGILKDISWIVILAICTLPLAIMISYLRLKNVYQATIFLLVQPLITKGVIKGLLRREPYKKYDPKISTIKTGEIYSESNIQMKL